MKTTTTLRITLPALCLVAATCAVQAQEEWISYRDAYRQMVVFAKYGKPKHFLQIHYQVAPRDASAALEGLHLTLTGKNTQLTLPLDATGRAVFPLLKAAYDDNAVLALNRRMASYRFIPRVSILSRNDGIYEAADLHAACEQALAYQRFVDSSYGAKKCAGVRFVFVNRADALVQVKFGPREAPLPVVDGPAFDGEALGAYRTATYRFSDWSTQGQVVSQNTPLAIAPLFD
ncbi:hypothetical protein [Pseudoduganella violaceinigra]|uniref:hypothetical protein n=1 Tax=Pseudoduganella violaceinigra TaxID=246602 RepID=UPI0003FCCED8|nr:hypothetical protein [Pseudoduganella violaceinigra]